jgi:predicted NAD/FAD-binding protein
MVASRSSIAVIGGGVTGVVAVYLLQNDHDVTLFEKTVYADVGQAFGVGL